MPQIPTVALSEMPAAPALAPRASADAYNATNRAISGAGGALQDVGSTLGRFALEKQQQVNKGILAAEETVRMQTAAQIEAYADENQGTPETWGKFRDSAWKGYEQGRAKRAKEQGWGPRVVADDKMLATAYQAETGIRFRTQENKALIRQSNDRLRGNASARAYAGDWKGALEVIDQMNLTEGAKVENRQAVIADGFYHDYERQLSDITTLPPAQQLTAFDEVEKELATVDKKGEPTAGILRDADGNVLGGLNEGARNNLLREARGKINAVNSRMADVGRSLVTKAAAGQDPSLAFQRAFDAGEITEEVAAVFVPEINAALATRAEAKAAKEEAKADALATRRDRGEATAQAMIDAPRGATLTFDEIERRQAIGITRPNDPNGLTAEAANRLRARLEAVESGDMAGQEVGAIEASLQSRLGRGVFRTYFSDNAQMTPEEKNKMLGRIAGARVSVGAKLKLMNTFFEVQKWDLREGEVTERDGDRELSAEERELRASLVETYKQAGRQLGPQAIGARYMADIDKIGAWFRANESASPAAKQAKAAEFYGQIRSAVDSEAATALIRTVPIFQ